MRTHLKAAALAAVTLLLVLAGLITSSLASGASTTPVRVGAVPNLPSGALLGGVLDPTQSMSVDVALQPSDPAGLAAYAQAVSTPGNAEYHAYLTVSQFREEFGPSQSSIDAVDSALQAAGLTPGAVSANGLIIPVTGTSAQLASAFDTTFENVTLPGGRIAFANTRAPQFSASVSSLIQGVVGLDDLSQEEPMDVHVAHEHRVAPRHTATLSRRVLAHENAHTTAPVACSSATAQSTFFQQHFPAVNGNAYTAPEVASTYGISSLWNANDFGAGQTVGLVEYEEYAPSDVSTYDQCYGEGTGTNVTETNVAGGPAADPNYTDGQYGAGEAILDIQQITGLAPAANIDVYEAPNNSNSATLTMYNDLVDNPAINVISTSWGECESLETLSAAKTENTIFEQAAVEGKSIFAAAGDDGSNDCYPAGDTNAQNASLAIDFPGADPWVTSVGGTTLINGTNTDQTVWNDSGAQYNTYNPSSTGNGAGGGGVSEFYAMPSYQSGAAASTGVINSGSSKATCAADSGNTGGYCREVPDVSADADGFTGYVGVYEGGWEASGGTSAAAPLWAALTALANASSSCASSPIGFANGVLYGVADNPTEQAADFTDITVGNNAYSESGYTGTSFAAGTGFDEASGLGTPNAATLVPDMCAAAATGQFKATTTTATPTTTTSTGTGTTTTPVYNGPPKLVIQVTKPKTGQTTVGVKMLCYGALGHHCSKVLTILFSLQTIRNGRVVALSAIRQAKPQRTRYQVVVFGSQRTQLATGYEVTFRLGLRGIGKLFFARHKNVKTILDFSYNGRYHVRAIKFVPRHAGAVGTIG